MKVAIIAFLACIAVSNAAFTGSLVQQAKPILGQALFKARLASRGNEYENELVSNLNQHANDLLAQIDAAVTNGQAVASNLVEDLQQTVAALQEHGAVVSQNVQSALQTALETLSNVWETISGLWGSIFGRSRLGLSDIVSAIQGAHATFQQIQAAGGLSGILNSVLAHASEIAAGISIQDILAQIFSQNRGLLGNLVNGLQTAGQNAFSQIQAAAAAQLQAAIVQITAQVGPALEAVQALAQQHIQNAQSQIAAVAAQAQAQLQQILAALPQYQAALGAQYQEIVAQINALLGN